MKLLVPLLCGMAAAWHIRVPFIVPAAAAALLLAAAMLLRRTEFRTPAFFLLLVALGGAKMTLDLTGTDPDAIERFVSPGGRSLLACRISEVPRAAASTIRFVAEAESVSTGGAAGIAHGPVFVVLRRDTLLEAGLTVGRRLALEGELALPEQARNPGAFDQRAYLLIHGIHTAFLQTPGSRPRLREVDYGGIVGRLVIPVRSAIAARIDSLFAPDEATFLRSLIIGDRSDLGAEVKNAFINAGVMHVIAVSGLHVAVVVLMLFALIRIIRLPDWAGFVLLCASLVYYIPLTGSSPSVARSVLMALILLGARLFQRKADMVNTLAVSAVVLLLIDARQMLDPGFQLSYAAVLSLIAGLRHGPGAVPGGRLRRMLRLLGTAVRVSVAASLGTFPITAYHFGTISLAGIAANAIVVPLSNAVLGLGMVAVAASFLWGWLGQVYAAAAGVCTTALLDVVRWFAGMPLAASHLSLGGAGVAAWYCVLALVLGAASRIYRKPAIICGSIAADAAMAFWLLRPLPPPVLRVTVLDVGQGDAIVLEFPNGTAMLLDAGATTRTSDMGAAVVVPFLRHAGIRSLEAVIVSHPHDDHLGGVPSVLRAVPVRRAVDAGFGGQGRLSREYLRLCDSLRLERQAVSAGHDIWCADACRMYLLHPSGDAGATPASGGSEVNNQSLVVKLVYGSSSILLSGDAEAESEERITGIYGDFVRCNVVKAGHHGSATSSSEGYLRAVGPERAIVSVGRKNRFGHPSPVVLRRLEARGCEVLRTDESGAVVLESDGRFWRVVTWR